MYMHKKGVEYYMALTGHFLGELNKKENVEHFNNYPGMFLKDKFAKLGDRNTLEVLKELDQHCKNIHDHLESEKNTIKIFGDKIHSHIGTTIFDPKSQSLIKIIKSADRLDGFYKQLKECADTAIVAYDNLLKNNEKMRKDELSNHFHHTLNVFKDMHDQLRFIYGESQEFASKLKSYISEIKKEEELIKREEQIAENFERNLMSWF